MYKVSAATKTASTTAESVCEFCGLNIKLASSLLLYGSICVGRCMYYLCTCRVYTSAYYLAIERSAAATKNDSKKLWVVFILSGIFHFHLCTSRAPLYVYLLACVYLDRCFKLTGNLFPSTLLSRAHTPPSFSLSVRNSPNIVCLWRVCLRAPAFARSCIGARVC